MAVIFAKDDSHAEDIVKIIREEFGKGNDFAQKITYKTTGAKPEDLISSFRNSFNPRIAVTVDMIATGTDIKPLEIVMFMRAVKSRSFFEQMKGRGVRIINSNDLQAVTPDAKVKDHFIIVDCVGVCELDKTDSRPMERKSTVSFEKLLQAVSLGNTDPEVVFSLAGRMARIGRQISPADDQKVTELSGGRTIEQLTTDLVIAIKPDNQIEKARQDNGGVEPSDEQRQWLIMIRDHIAANLGIETDDFDYAPFAQEGGLGRVHQLFGEELQTILAALNEALAA